jgi:ATP synthase protein I
LVTPYGALAFAGAKSFAITISRQFSMTERKPPKPRDDLDQRLNRFRDEQNVTGGRTGNPQSTHSGLGFAMRIGVELVAALIIGIGLGYLLDGCFGTMPLMSLLGFAFGAAAGFLNVYRVATGQGSTVGYRKPPEGDDKPGGDV